MRILPKAIAHVSFPGGGIFLPARSPYDLQMLTEHIADRVRSKGHVQVLLDEQRWMVHLNRGPIRICCASCGDSADSTCYRAPDGDAAYCVPCALGPATEFAASIPVQQAS